MSATTAALPLGDGQAALTIASEHRDFADWHRGRRQYALWAIDMPEFDGAIVAMRKHLAAYLLPGYARQAHVTLSVCGFPRHDAGPDDDVHGFSAADFAAQVDALRGAQLAPFAIEIGAAATFSSAAYFAVDDPQGKLTRLHRTLTRDEEITGDPPYVPHLTFGLYRASYPIAQMLQHLRRGPNPQRRTHHVDRVSLMTYETAVVTGALRRVCEYDLARQSLRVLDATALDAMWRRPSPDHAPFSSEAARTPECRPPAGAPNRPVRAGR